MLRVDGTAFSLCTSSKKPHPRLAHKHTNKQTFTWNNTVKIIKFKNEGYAFCSFPNKLIITGQFFFHSSLSFTYTLIFERNVWCLHGCCVLLLYVSAFVLGINLGVLCCVIYICVCVCCDHEFCFSMLCCVKNLSWKVFMKVRGKFVMKFYDKRLWTSWHYVMKFMT